ncbi:MAG: hypothetical protein H6R40_36 [Gemmatimonadetes bacterium]|nr:hypothetical protein [Gemmatimonadota bacterium]
MTQLELDGQGSPDAAGEPPASPLPPREQLTAWRQRISPLVHFGTSTWTYPGWAGLVYSRRYPEQGASAKMLAEYARFPLFSTVGIDSSFYGPPRPKTLESWGRALPEGFPCVSKVWDRLTVHTFAGKREPRSVAGKANPDFLNPNLFLAEVYQPFREHFGGHVGPFVFEFQTMAGLGPRGAEAFADRLDAFFGILPRDAQYAVELRNEEFLTPARPPVRGRGQGLLPLRPHPGPQPGTPHRPGPPGPHGRAAPDPRLADRQQPRRGQRTPHHRRGRPGPRRVRPGNDDAPRVKCGASGGAEGRCVRAWSVSPRAGRAWPGTGASGGPRSGRHACRNCEPMP